MLILLLSSHNLLHISRFVNVVDSGVLMFPYILLKKMYSNILLNNFLFSCLDSIYSMAFSFEYDFPNTSLKFGGISVQMRPSILFFLAKLTSSCIFLSSSSDVRYVSDAIFMKPIFLVEVFSRIFSFSMAVFRLEKEVRA